MKTNKSVVNRATRFAALIMAAGIITLVVVAPAFSQEGWRASFDDICSKVETSGTLDVKELTVLIERVDKLIPEIQASSDPSKKIYLQRIKKCRSLFEFMIESKKS